MKIYDYENHVVINISICDTNGSFCKKVILCMFIRTLCLKRKLRGNHFIKKKVHEYLQELNCILHCCIYIFKGNILNKNTA